MRNWCPIAPGSQICATWVAPGLIYEFARFAASWPVQSGSRSFLEGASKKCDLGCATRVALILKWASFYEFPRTSRVALWDSLDWKSCDLLCSSEGHRKQWSGFSNKLSPGKLISKVYNFVDTLVEFLISMDRFERLQINLGGCVCFEHVQDMFVTRLSGTKWVAVARHGLILWENEATSLGIIFKCLPGLWDTI